jgi:hypothetical protein
VIFISQVERSRQAGKQASKQELFPFLRKSSVLHHLTGIPIFAYSPDVEFCGYSIPHPSEAVMNLRIQTWGESNNPDSDSDPLRANIPSSRRENGGLTLRFLSLSFRFVQITSASSPSSEKPSTTSRIYAMSSRTNSPPPGTSSMPSILIASAHELSTQLREMTAVFIWSRERGLLGATNGLEVSRPALRRHWNRAGALSLSLSLFGWTTCRTDGDVRCKPTPHREPKVFDSTIGSTVTMNTRE